MKSKSRTMRAGPTISRTLLITALVALPLLLIGWRTSLALGSELLGFMAAVMTLLIGAATLSAVKPERRAAY